MKPNKKQCGNCSNCEVLHRHPWNKTIGKGSIMEPMGWVCTTIDDVTHMIFMDSDFGECEEWTAKDSK